MSEVLESRSVRSELATGARTDPYISTTRYSPISRFASAAIVGSHRSTTAEPRKSGDHSLNVPSIIPVMDDDRTLRDSRGTETIADSRRGKMVEEIGSEEREREREADEREIREAYF